MKILDETPEFQSLENIIFSAVFDNPLKTCRECEKFIEFSKTIYRNPEFCSNSCVNRNREVHLKARQTCIRKYGVNNPQKNEEIRCRTEHTCMEKYGVSTPLKNRECIEKGKQTSLEKFGAEQYSQTDQFKEKMKQISMKKFGTEFMFQSKEIKKKSQDTCIRKFGTEFPMQSEEIKKKARKACIQKFGTANPAKSDEIKKKIKQTCLIKYGQEHPWKNQQVRRKRKQTMEKKYGVQVPVMNPGLKQKIIKGKLHFSYNQLLENKYLCLCFRLSSGWDSVKKSYRWKCRRCGNEFTAKFSSVKILNQKDETEKLFMPRCLKCFPVNCSCSKDEKQLMNFCRNFFQSAFKPKRNEIIKGQLDIYIPQLKLAIEFNGDYWHSIEKSQKNFLYHKRKTEACQALGIRLIHVWEHQWNSDKEEIKNRLKDIFTGNQKFEFQENRVILNRDWFPSFLEIPGYVLKSIEDPEIKQLTQRLHIAGSGKLIYEKI